MHSPPPSPRKKKTFSAVGYENHSSETGGCGVETMLSLYGHLPRQKYDLVHNRERTSCVQKIVGCHGGQTPSSA